MNPESLTGTRFPGVRLTRFGHPGPSGSTPLGQLSASVPRRRPAGQPPRHTDSSRLFPVIVPPVGGDHRYETKRISMGHAHGSRRRSTLAVVSPHGNADLAFVSQHPSTASAAGHRGGRTRFTGAWIENEREPLSVRRTLRSQVVTAGSSSSWVPALFPRASFFRLPSCP